MVQGTRVAKPWYCSSVRFSFSLTNWSKTQGSTHLERGENFVAMLKGLKGSNGEIPANATVDYVPGVSHDGEGMQQSTQGINKVKAFSRVQILTSESKLQLFRYDWEGTGTGLSV